MPLLAAQTNVDQHDHRSQVLHTASGHRFVINWVITLLSFQKIVRLWFLNVVIPQQTGTCQQPEEVPQHL